MLTFVRKERQKRFPICFDSLKAQPDNPDTLCSLGSSYLAINALPLAEESITRALAINKLSPRVRLLLGIIRFRQNRLDEAEVAIRQGIELQATPSSVMLFHYYLG